MVWDMDRDIVAGSSIIKAAFKRLLSFWKWFISIGFPWVLWEIFKDRVAGWVNKQIDDTASQPMKAVEALLNWLATTPTGWSVLLVVFVLSALFAHSYWWEWKQQKIEDKTNPEPSGEITKHPSIDLVLKPPKHIYSLVWDAPESIDIITRPILSEGEEYPLGTRIPVLRIKNLGKEVARNLTVEWSAGVFGQLEREVLSCSRLRLFMPTIQGKMFGITSRDKGTEHGWQVGFSPTETSTIEYLAPVIDNKTYELFPIPYYIWAYVEILSIARLPETPLFSTVSLPIEAKITGNNGTQVGHFAVIANVHSTKPGGTGAIRIPIDGKMRTPPEVMAEIRFEIKQMDS